MTGDRLKAAILINREREQDAYDDVWNHAENVIHAVFDDKHIPVAMDCDGGVDIHYKSGGRSLLIHVGRDSDGVIDVSYYGSVRQGEQVVKGTTPGDLSTLVRLKEWVLAS